MNYLILLADCKCSLKMHIIQGNEVVNTNKRTECIQGIAP